MRSIFSICRKEIGAYFVSPIAYVLMAFFGLVIGIVFYASTRAFVEAGMRQQMMGQGGAMNMNDIVVAPLLGTANFLSVLLIPFISMRLFAKEKSAGTIELLMTSPVSDWGIVLGKWMGALVMYGCLVGMAALNILLLFFWGSPDWRPILTGFLGLLLQGGFMLALGGFISTTTKNEIIAGFATLALSLTLWLLSWFGEFNDAGWARAVAYCSILTHSEPFSKGVIDTKNLVFYFSAIFLGLFLSVRSLESLRWRA